MFFFARAPVAALLVIAAPVAAMAQTQEAAPASETATAEPSQAPRTEPSPDLVVDVPSDAADEGPAIEQLNLEELLNEPVVTASGGTTEERTLAAATVFVVTREQILRHGWRTLAEALASVPGLYVIDDHVMPSVGVRGVTGGLQAGTRLVKMMINGVAVNFRPELSAFIGPEFIPMDAVKRIEIVQGPLSALYGANAFVATVNVITRTANGKAATEVAARSTVINSHVGAGASAFLAQGDDDLGFIASFSQDYINRSGLSIQRTFPAQDPTSAAYKPLFSSDSQNDVSTPTSVYLNLHAGGKDSKRGQLTLQGGLQKLDSVGEFQVNSVLSHRSRYAIANYWSDLRYDYQWSEKLNVSAHAGYATGRPTRDYTLYLASDPNAYYQPQFSYQSGYGGLQANYTPLGKRLSVRVGADTELDSEGVLYYRQTFLIPYGGRNANDSLNLIGAGDPRRYMLRDIGLGAQVSSVPLPDSLPGLHLTGNIRGDFIKYGPINFPNQLSWRAGVVYEWSKTLVTKIIGGHAFQTPSGVLMFAKPGYGRSNNVVGNVDATRLGSPLLRPQGVTGAEAMVSTDVLGALHIDAGVYFQEIQDRIQFQQIATDFIASNSNSVQNLGGIASLDLHLFNRLTAYATGTAQQQIVNNRFVSAPPQQFPNYFGTAGVDVDIPEAMLVANGHLRWASARGSTQSNQLLNDGFYQLNGYTTFDLTLSTKNLHLWGDSETRLTASVRNLFDVHYSEPGFSGFDVPMFGRNFWFELAQSF